MITQLEIPSLISSASQSHGCGNIEEEKEQELGLRMLGMRVCKKRVFLNVLELQNPLVRALLFPSVPTCTLCVRGLVL